MKVARILVLSLAAALVFALAVYAIAAVAEGRRFAGKPDPKWAFVGEYGTFGTGGSNGVRLELAENGGCQRYEVWSEGGRSLFGQAIQGRWVTVGAQEIELRWNDGKVELGLLARGSEDGRSLLVDGAEYWDELIYRDELVWGCCTY